MTVTVRKARLTDSAELYRAWQALRWHNAAVDHRIVLAQVSEPEFASALRLTLEREDSLFIVAEEEHQIVGFASAGIEANQPDRLPERHVTVGYLYVLPSHRRHGVGSAILDQIDAWAGSIEGVMHVEMTVLAADEDAASFWGSLGFSSFISRLWKPLPGKSPD